MGLVGCALRVPMKCIDPARLQSINDVFSSGYCYILKLYKGTGSEDIYRERSAVNGNRQFRFAIRIHGKHLRSERLLRDIDSRMHAAGWPQERIKRALLSSQSWLKGVTQRVDQSLTLM
jgi:hypothetical protein